MTGAVVAVDLDEGTVQIVGTSGRRTTSSLSDTIKAHWASIQVFLYFSRAIQRRKIAFGGAEPVASRELAHRFESQMRTVLEEDGMSIHAWDVLERFTSPFVHVTPEIMTQMLTRAFYKCDLGSDEAVAHAFAVLRRVQGAAAGCTSDPFVPATKPFFEEVGWQALAELLESTMSDIALNPSPAKALDIRSGSRLHVPRERRRQARRYFVQYLAVLFDNEMTLLWRKEPEKLSECLLAQILLSRGDDATAITDIVPLLLRCTNLDNDHLGLVDAALHILTLMYFLQVCGIITASRPVEEAVHSHIRLERWSTRRVIDVVSAIPSAALRLTICETYLRKDASYPPNLPSSLYDRTPTLRRYGELFLRGHPTQRSSAAVVDYLALINASLGAYVETRVTVPLPSSEDRLHLSDLPDAVDAAAKRLTLWLQDGGVSVDVPAIEVERVSLHALLKQSGVQASDGTATPPVHASRTRKSPAEGESTAQPARKRRSISKSRPSDEVIVIDLMDDYALM